MLSSWINPSVLLALLLSACAAKAADDLGTRLRDAQAGTQTPAVAALVIRDGQIAEQAVHGLRRNDATAVATLDDTWLLGSTSKTMTVAAIARLVERGVLAWDRPLSAMLPEAMNTARPEYASVTLIDLLGHRSGLPENLRDHAAIDPYFDDPRPLPEQRLEYVRRVLADAPEAPPRSAFHYSNSGFLLAAVIAERAVGQPFEQILHDEVFKPLGMRSAAAGATAADQPQGHRAGRPKTQWHNADDGVPPMFSAAGYLHMSMHDWALFCLDQLAGSRGHGRLLSSASYRLMQTAQPGSPSGLDWGVQDSIGGRQGPVLVHGGSDGNWLAYVVLFPQSGNGVLVVANAAEDMGADGVIMTLLGGLFASLAPAATP